MRALILGILLAGPAMAQDAPAEAPRVDCLSDALTQAELSSCAGNAYLAADDELNEVYRLALVEVRAADERRAVEGSASDTTQETFLREAQRAWITFRDAACAAEAMQADGGSAQPMVGSLCLARLTLARTEDLRRLADPIEGSL